ncbi:MAG: FecR family protein [bacterium]
MRRALSFILAAAVCTAILPAGASAQGAGNIALVLKVFDARQLGIIEAGGEEYVGAIGDLLSDGDRVFTADDTRAAVRFTDDGSIIRMNPKTELLVRAEGDRTALRKTLEVDVGELWAKIQKREGAEYRIQTPTAVAAVKGTEFFVRVEEDGSTTIITTEGVLDFFNDVETVEVPAGSTARIGSSSEEPTLTSTTDDDVTSFGQLASDAREESGEDEMVEIIIPFVDEDGNQKTMIIRMPRDQASRYLPPQD